MAYTKGEVFVKKESTWGVGVDPTTPIIGIDELLGIDSEYEYSLENKITAVNPAAMAQPSEISYHSAKASGKIDFVYNGGLPFALMLGGIANSDPLEDEPPYTWEITPSVSPIPFTASFMMRGANDKLAQISGCFARSLSFKMGINEPVSGTLDLVGKDLNLNAPFTPPTTVSLDDAKAWKPHEFTYSIGSIAGITYITELEFTISRSIDVGHGLASRAPSTAYSGKFEAVNGTMTCYIPDSGTSDEIEQLVLGGSSISESLSPNDIVIDRGYADEADDAVKITLSSCVFGDLSSVFPLDTKVSYKFGFSAASASILWEAPFSKANW